jgi:anti-anti-sigma factor
MDLNVTQQGDVPVYRLKGRLGIDGTAEFEQTLLRAIDAGASRLVFVVDELDYLSSAGLRVFCVAIKRLGGDGSRLSFAGLKPFVRQIFDVTGLSASVRIFSTEAEALAALPTGAPQGS